MAYHSPLHPLEYWKPGVLTAAAKCLCCKESIPAGADIHFSGRKAESGRLSLCDPCWIEYQAGAGYVRLMDISRFRKEK